MFLLRWRISPEGLPFLAPEFTPGRRVAQRGIVIEMSGVGGVALDFSPGLRKPSPLG